jgi:hypothetical protein
LADAFDEQNRQCQSNVEELLGLLTQQGIIPITDIYPRCLLSYLFQESLDMLRASARVPSDKWN